MSVAKSEGVVMTTKIEINNFVIHEYKSWYDVRSVLTSEPPKIKEQSS